MTYKVSSGTLNLCSLTHSRMEAGHQYRLVCIAVCDVESNYFEECVRCRRLAAAYAGGQVRSLSAHRPTQHNIHSINYFASPMMPHCRDVVTYVMGNPVTSPGIPCRTSSKITVTSRGIPRLMMPHCRDVVTYVMGNPGTSPGIPCRTSSKITATSRGIPRHFIRCTLLKLPNRISNDSMRNLLISLKSRDVTGNPVTSL